MVITLTKPSSLLHEIRLEKVGQWHLFKFSESLQIRMETLLEKKKADQLTPEEIVELDTIGELDRIFIHINGMMAAQSDEWEDIYQGRFQQLRQEIGIGLDAADRGELVDAQEVFQQLRVKLQQRRKEGRIFLE
jgi:hypothetical protein